MQRCHIILLIIALVILLLSGCDTTSIVSESYVEEFQNTRTELPALDKEENSEQTVVCIRKMLELGGSGCANVPRQTPMYLSPIYDGRVICELRAGIYRVISKAEVIYSNETSAVWYLMVDEEGLPGWIKSSNCSSYTKN